MSRLEISEHDEAGNLTASHIESVQQPLSEMQAVARVDTIYPEKTKSYAQQLLDVFLPAGYPHTVTDDYIQYQIYDSLQAFSSSIAGMLSSRAVLEGVGVGDATASPTSALLLSVLQESMGRIATILFAHKLGTSLEPECKSYRLAADIFNDTAMIFDCLSPAFPKPLRVLVLGCSSVLRSLCGVAAGSSKASLSAHFAKCGNLGELNAKDSSQETVISLLGMLAGSAVVSWVSSPLATWATLLLLLSVHLAMNHAAVRAVSMRSLNRQRANIVFSHILQHHKVLRPTDVSTLERIFERDGVLRWSDNKVIGRASIGVNIDFLLTCLAGKERHIRTGSRNLQAIKLSELMRLYAHDAYVLWFDVSRSEVLIVLKQGCKPIDQIQAWAHALLVARRAEQQAVNANKAGHENVHISRCNSDFGLTELEETLKETKEMLQENADRLRAAGWDLDVAALETTSGTRAVMKET